MKSEINVFDDGEKKIENKELNPLCLMRIPKPHTSGVSGESIPDDDRVDEAGEGGEELLEIRISDLVSQAQDDQLPVRRRRLGGIVAAWSPHQHGIHM